MGEERTTIRWTKPTLLAIKNIFDDLFVNIEDLELAIA